MTQSPLLDCGNKIAEGLREAVAIVAGEHPAPRVHMYGHAYVPEAALLAAEEWQAKQRDDLMTLGQELGAAITRIKELETRLEMNFAWKIDEDTGNFVRIEVEPGSIPDGIDARDETIKLQDANNDWLRARVKELEAAIAGLSDCRQWEPECPHAALARATGAKEMQP